MKTTRLLVAVRNLSVSALSLVLFLTITGCSGGYGGGGGGDTPNITMLSPTSGPVGAAVTITGTNFGASQGSSSVTFYNNQTATVTSWSATSIVVSVPAGASTGSVVVSVGGVASNGVSFTVTTGSGSAFPIKLSANKR